MCIKDKQIFQLFIELVRNQKKMPPHWETLSPISQCPLSTILTKQIEKKAQNFQSHEIKVG